MIAWLRAKLTPPADPLIDVLIKPPVAIFTGHEQARVEQAFQRAQRRIRRRIPKLTAAAKPPLPFERRKRA